MVIHHHNHRDLLASGDHDNIPPIVQMVQGVPCVAADAMNIPGMIIMIMINIPDMILMAWKVSVLIGDGISYGIKKSPFSRLRQILPFPLECKEVFVGDWENIGVCQTRGSTSSRVVSEDFLCIFDLRQSWI